MNTTLSPLRSLPCLADRVWAVDACHGAAGTLMIWRDAADDRPILMQHSNEGNQRVHDRLLDLGTLPARIVTSDPTTVEFVRDVLAGTPVEVSLDAQASSSEAAECVRAAMLMSWCAVRYFGDDVPGELRGALLDKLEALRDIDLPRTWQYLHVDSPLICGIRIDNQPDRLLLILERANRRGCMVLSLGVQEEYGYEGEFVYAGRPRSRQSLDAMVPLEAMDVVRAHHALDILCDWKEAGAPHTGTFGGFQVWAVPRREPPPPPTSQRTLRIKAFHKASRITREVEVQEDETFAALYSALSRAFDGLGHSYRFALRLSRGAALDVWENGADTDLLASMTTLTDLQLTPGSRLAYEDYDDRLRLVVTGRGTITRTRTPAGG